MRYAIFGDIHGNLEALTAVIEEIGKADIDECICLGDLVGYGGNPEECVERVRELNSLCVAGNHDYAAIGHLDISFFNALARDAAVWTSKALSGRSKDYLQSLSFVEHLTNFVIVHGSLQAPEAFNYIQTVREAEYTFRLMDKNVCFCGHSHIPLTFFDSEPMTYSLDTEVQLKPETKVIVNVGSVGQPRDERPEASFAIYDEDAGRVELKRVGYDVQTAAKKITEAGLPEPLALRLFLGK